MLMMEIITLENKLTLKLRELAATPVEIEQILYHYRAKVWELQELGKAPDLEIVGEFVQDYYNEQIRNYGIGWMHV